jgi:hypothetical protein
MFNHVEPIILLAAQNNILAIYPWRPVVAKHNALLSYGPDLKDIVRRGAPYVDQIFRGAKPAESTGSSAGEIRDGSKRQDGQGTGPHSAAKHNLARRRDNRIASDLLHLLTAAFGP